MGCQGLYGPAPGTRPPWRWVGEVLPLSEGGEGGWTSPLGRASPPYVTTPASVYLALDRQRLHADGGVPLRQMRKLGLEGELGLWEGSHSRVLAGKDTEGKFIRGSLSVARHRQGERPGSGGGV